MTNSSADVITKTPLAQKVTGIQFQPSQPNNPANAAAASPNQR